MLSARDVVRAAALGYTLVELLTEKGDLRTASVVLTQIERRLQREDIEEMADEIDEVPHPHLTVAVDAGPC